MKKIDENYFLKKEDVNNSSIDDVLDDNEKILWRSKPLKKSYVLNSIFKMLPIALIWLIFDAGFLFVLFTFMNEIPTHFIIMICVFFVLHLAPVWIWLFNMISAFKRHKIEEYAFTDKRILVKKGFIGSDVRSILYSSIVSVNLKVGLVEKMCHVGDIYIVSQNEKVVLEDIKDPLFIVSKLQKISNDIKSDIYYPNALRPDINPGYNTTYNPNKKDEK